MLLGKGGSPPVLRRDRSPGHSRGLTNGISSAPKSSALLSSHLTRELVGVKDELVLKADMVEQLEDKARMLVLARLLCRRASRVVWVVFGKMFWQAAPTAGLERRCDPAAQLVILLLFTYCTMLPAAACFLLLQVLALEHDKNVITNAFERVLSGMQGDMRDVKQRLEQLHAERNRLAAQLDATQAARVAAEAERDELRGRLDAERGTALNTLGSLHQQQEDAQTRAANAEEQLRALENKHKEDIVVFDALKKQMVFYQHAVVTAGGAMGELAGGLAAGAAGGGVVALRGAEKPELRYWETLAAVEDLLLREADPEGERYSLAKVLATCQPELHPIFLHYCLLDPGFARHWPPQLTLAGWLTFMKDTGVTNLVPGTRTRSDTTIHVSWVAGLGGKEGSACSP